MKWGLIALNLGAAVAVVLAGTAVSAIHRTHSYSTYVELESRGALAKAPKRVHPEDPVGPDGNYDVAKRLETIGNLEEYLTIVTYSAATVFVVNAFVFFALWAKKPGSAPLSAPVS
jgi:hypothetical protein